MSRSLVRIKADEFNGNLGCIPNPERFRELCSQTGFPGKGCDIVMGGGRTAVIQGAFPKDDGWYDFHIPVDPSSRVAEELDRWFTSRGIEAKIGRASRNHRPAISKRRRPPRTSRRSIKR